MPTHHAFDQARQAFLAPVAAQLATGGIAGASAQYRRIPGFCTLDGILALVLRAPALPGEARILAMTVAGGRTADYGAFPGEGVPHYQLFLLTPDGSYAGYLLSRDPTAIVSTLVRWATSGQALLRQALAPLGEGDLAPLRRLAAVRSSIRQAAYTLLSRGVERCSQEMEQALGLVRAPDLLSLAAELTDDARPLFETDLAHLAPDLVMRSFPRDEDGRLPLDTTALLASYAAQVPQGRDRHMWLAACGPKRRRDPQVVTLTLASLIGVNHAARWDQARFWWDDRHESASRELRWGVAALALDRLGLEDRAEQLASFAQRCARPDASLADRVGYCLLLQDEGRIEEAFALFGVSLAPEVLKVLYAQPLSIDYGSLESWAATMLDLLRHAAPWRFAAALETGTRLRLSALPHQPQQRKASLMLARVNLSPQTPRLEIEWTASNKRLAEVAWRRPLALDLIRFHLE